MTPSIKRIIVWTRAHRQWLALAALAVVATLAFIALRLVLHEVHLRDVRAALHDIDSWRIAAALGFTAISYIALTFYDWLALIAIGKPLRWTTAAMASFTSYTLSHNLGLSLLSGGAARYRVYHAAGLDLLDVARVQAITAVGFWGGIMGFSGVALLTAAAPPVVALDQARLIGIALIALLAIIPVARLCGRTSVSIAGASLPIPDGPHYAAILVASLVDLTAASAALFVLVPSIGIGVFPDLVVAYTIAILVALVTHVPGGLGVFEAVVLATFPADRPTVFAALIAYRAIYYLLPLVIAMTLTIAVEGHRLRHSIGAGLSLLHRATRALAPTAIALLVFIGGLILLLSGALPSVRGRLSLLEAIVPLPFIEASHLAGSLVGTALILIAPALNARMRSSFHACRLLLLSGAAFSLVKGIDYEEAAVLIGIALLLQYCRPTFTRDARLLAEPIDWTWLGAAATAIALSIWAGLFAYQRVPFADALWWRFALDGDAPRFLRASFAAGVLLAAAAAWHFLTRIRVPGGLVELPAEVLDRALAGTTRTDTNLAFTGDKRFVVSAAGDAFLMYAIRGRSWVVMGDPVGDRAAWSELAWSIRRACAASRGRLCFYQASEAMLPLFVDLGLATMKYGEEARIALDRFSLDGPAAKPLRHAVRKAEAAGVSVSIVRAANVPALLPRLRVISDAWLAAKGAREKRFSLGWFDEAYMTRFDCAVAWRDGQPIAFANMWTTRNRYEASVDLMRHADDIPYGVMDYLFVRLIELSRDAGYVRFNLGLTPLSGMPTGPLAPLWARLGTTAFHTGERLYGFAGLRHFKAKFSPDWVPRYIATPGGIGAMRALIDLTGIVNAKPGPPATPPAPARSTTAVPLPPARPQILSAIRPNPRPGGMAQ